MSTTIRRRGKIVPTLTATLFAILAFLSFALPTRAAPCAPGTAPCASTLLDTYYNIAAGDNLVRLISPDGASASADRCAMIYVFDSKEEMGECCGCPLSPQKLLSLSVEKNLTADWALSSGSPQSGVIEIISAARNVSTSGKVSRCSLDPTCNGGCDPTSVPGFVTTRELKGYIVHNRALSTASGSKIYGVPEVSLADAGDPDPLTMNSLSGLCGAIIGNGTDGGICNCKP